VSATEREKHAAGPEDEYVTVPEAARQLRVAESTVWRWVASETLPAYRLGPKRVLIRRDDLAAVIAPRPAPPIGRRRTVNTMSTAARKAMLAAVAESREAFAAARAGSAKAAAVDTLALLDESREERDRAFDASA
jgi:excisionase family DNA binding protein